MSTLFIIAFSIIIWTTLSTFVYKIMTDVMDIDFDTDPRVFLATVFSPIGIFILIGYGFGLLLLKRLDEFIKRIRQKFNE